MFSQKSLAAGVWKRSQEKASPDVAQVSGWKTTSDQPWGPCFFGETGGWQADLQEIMVLLRWMECEDIICEASSVNLQPVAVGIIQSFIGCIENVNHVLQSFVCN